MRVIVNPTGSDAVLEVASGIYFYRLGTAEGILTRKLALLR